MSRRSRRRSRAGYPMWVKLIVSALMTLALFLLAEGLLRSAGVASAYRADLIGGWGMLPELDQREMTGREGHSFVLSTNADGLRTSLTRARSSGRIRIALLGDSTVFGWGSSEGGTLADGLQAALDKKSTGTYEVLNAAQPGYSTTQAARFFEDIVQYYTPDLTIVFVPMHDYNMVMISDRENLDGASGPLSAARVLLARHSRIYQKLRSLLIPMHQEQFLLPRSTSDATRVPRVSDAERADNLARIHTLQQGWGGALAVGHVPFLGDLSSSGLQDRHGAQWLRTHAQSKGYGMVDLRACCGPDGSHLVLPHDPGHLTAEGNLMAGRAALAPVLVLLSR